MTTVGSSLRGMRPLTFHPALESYAPLIRYYLDAGRDRIQLPIQDPIGAPAVLTVFEMRNVVEAGQRWRVAVDAAGRYVAGKAASVV